MNTEIYGKLKHVFVSFQDFVGNFFCLKSGQIQQRRGIYFTQDFDIERNLTLEICSLVNCYSSVKIEHCISLDSNIFVDGRNKENRVSKLKINGIVSWSVIYLSGRTQGSEF